MHGTMNIKFFYLSYANLFCVEIIKVYFRGRYTISLKIQKYDFSSIPSDSSVTSKVKYVFLPRKINLKYLKFSIGIGIALSV